jgi:glycosyltransferase involved in cell wall biosynthesis
MSVSMLCEQLVKANCQVSMFTTTANGKEELAVNTNEVISLDGVMVTYFERITKDHTHYSPALLKELWKVARHYDAIHIHAWWNLVSVFACIIALTRKIPVVVSTRGTLSPYSFQNKNTKIKWAIHMILGVRLLKKSHIHATSFRELQAVQKIVTSKGISILPNFIRLPGQVHQFGNNDTTVFKLLFLSRIEEKKGLELLLEALPLLDFQYHLTIAGSGDEVYVSALKQMANNLKVSNCITWAGFVNERKFELFAKHDLFVLPSYDENFGNAVIESLCVGTPVLISQEVGLATYVTSNDLGWLCDTNAESIAYHINKIYHRGAFKLKRIREHAAVTIYKDFDNNHLVQKYIALYQNIINK